MLVLGIETSTSQVGVAIGGHEGVLASFHSTRDRRHAETLVPAIEFVARQARVDLADLGCVAVDIGPGLFTGLRVGMATAKSMAHALGVPMVGVSSLDLVAFPARWTSRLVVATVDARRGEIFHAGYRRVPGGIQRLTEPAVDAPEEVAASLSADADDVLLVGEGALRHRQQFDEIRGVEIADEMLRWPDARNLVELAHPQALREQFVQPWELEPLYLRAPDAQINFASRDGA